MDVNIEHRITEVEQRSKSNTKRIDKLDRRQEELIVLANSIKIIAEREEHLEKSVDEIKNDVKEMKDKPAKRMDYIIDTIIKIVLGAVVGYVMLKLGF